MLLALLRSGNQQLPEVSGSQHLLPGTRTHGKRDPLVGNLLELHGQRGRGRVRRAADEDLADDTVGRDSHVDRQFIFLAVTLVGKHTLAVLVADLKALLSDHPLRPVVKRADVGQPGGLERNPAINDVTAQAVLEHVV